MTLPPDPGGAPTPPPRRGGDPNPARRGDHPELYDWKPLVEELQSRRDHALGMGGPDRIERQRSLGKMTVRERLHLLLDRGSFVEYGLLADHMDPGLASAGYEHLAADGMVAGI